MPFGCSKGNGIKELAKFYNIDLCDVAVVGDSNNDVNMFEITSNSYCMDHADEEVSKHANHIVKDVAQAIKEFVR